jgi:phage shock protein PspC (stress-responsive transcriptional regulator)
MNKILNINLGGYALTIDDDAYEYLQAYLESIRKRFSESEGRDEIVHDIEMRLGELMSKDLGARTIVMMPDVEAAVRVMGKPEDFGGEPTETRSSRTSGRPATGARTIQTGKRLFRDEEDKIAGGVCSGLAAYFGISDPVWMRLGFVLLTLLSGGFWVPAYILLWILVPPAKTAADRLAMRGQPVNVDNIAKEVEEGFERIGTHFSPEARSKGQRAMHTGVTAIGQIFAFAVRFFIKFGALIAILVGIALVIALAVSWVTGIWSLFVAAPYVEYFSPVSNHRTWLAFANIFFLLSIPVVGICLLFSRILFRVRTPGWQNTSFGIFWSMNLACLIILVAIATKQYRQASLTSKTVDLSAVRSDTLRVESANAEPVDEYDEDLWFHSRWIKMRDDRLEIEGPIEILVVPSESGRFECTQTIRARGATGFEAQKNAEHAEYSIVTTGNVIRIPTKYIINKGNKWRVQEVKIKIGVPMGSSIVFGKYINQYAKSSNYTDQSDGPKFRDQPDKVFKMTSKGLECSDCPQFGDREYNGRDYENFILQGEFDTEIRQGDRFSIQMEGAHSDRNMIQTIRAGDKITFTTNGKHTRGKVRLIIETPTFTSLHADNTGEVVIRGFNENTSSISTKGNSKVKGYFDSNELTLVLAGKGTVELTGKGDELKASVTDGASLEASSWRTDNAKISATNNSNAHINANNEVSVKSDISSHITVDGTATLKKNEDN